MKKIVLKGHIIVPDSDLATVKDALPVHIGLTRKELGCLVFEVTQDENIKNKFHVHEEFINKAAFTNHQKRITNSKWGLVSKNVERFYKVTGLNE